MNLPGNNELSLTDAAICAALEDAINGSRKDGEDWIRVTGVKRTYSHLQWIATITTDAAEVADPVAIKVVA